MDSGKKLPTDSELSIAKSFEDISIHEDGTEGDASESGVVSYKTFQTFASDWSACSNASFTRYIQFLII